MILVDLLVGDIIDWQYWSRNKDIREKTHCLNTTIYYHVYSPFYVIYLSQDWKKPRKSHKFLRKKMKHQLFDIRPSKLNQYITWIHFLLFISLPDFRKEGIKSLQINFIWPNACNKKKRNMEKMHMQRYPELNNPLLLYSFITPLRQHETFNSTMQLNSSQLYTFKYYNTN